MRKLILAGSAIFLAALLILACSSDKSPVSSGTSTSITVLVLDDAGTEEPIILYLTYLGINVTRGGHYGDHLATDFSGYDLVILLDGVNYGYTMPDSVQQGLIDYVFDGGVLLTTEWLIEEGYNPILETLLPLDYLGGYTEDAETYTKMAVHPITDGLPSSFVTRDSWTLTYMGDNAASISTNRVVLFEGAEGGPAMGIGDYGSGKTIHWGMAGDYSGSMWSDEIYMIILNIVNYSATI